VSVCVHFLLLNGLHRIICIQKYHCFITREIENIEIQEPFCETGRWAGGYEINAEDWLI
jgi:hypothetical protein